MASCPSSSEAYWTSVLFILAVATILIANALLLHGASRKPRGGLFSRKGRFLRPLLRQVTGSSSGRSRSRSTSISSLPPGTSEEYQPQDAPPPPPSLSSEVWEAAARWVRWDPNASTRAIVEGWIQNGDEDSASRGLMGKRLSFGTSGLRGVMGPGFCRINDLVVMQTTQGLCRYLEKEGGEAFKARGVVIGRDHRAQGGLSSEGFANLAAAVFVSRGFRVHLMAGTVATPLVAFGVCYTDACAGVMVTASHNPKKDNGYKVYWSNGSQIIPPHDVGIAASIARNLEPWQRYDPASAIASPLCSDPTEHLAEAYFQGIRDGLCRRPDANARSGLEVVYSAMHGVGDAWARRAFDCFSLPPFLSVASQMEPDPEFPTVAFPNPEEQGALKEAMRLAEEKGVPFVLANDPDGDRLAVAERQPSGEWYVFSGNEIGTLLGVWQWEEWRRTHPHEDASDAVMIASTVSSKMLSAVAAQEGFTFEETLPGFKWMGHRGQAMKAQGKTILFAFEEAIGFGPGDVVFEKDGLSSAALFAEMVAALRDQGQQQIVLPATTAAAAIAAGSEAVAPSSEALAPSSFSSSRSAFSPPSAAAAEAATAAAASSSSSATATVATASAAAAAAATTATDTAEFSSSSSRYPFSSSSSCFSLPPLTSPRDTAMPSPPPQKLLPCVETHTASGGGGRSGVGKAELSPPPSPSTVVASPPPSPTPSSTSTVFLVPSSPRAAPTEAAVVAVAVDGGGGGGGGSGGGDGSSACEGVQEVPWRGEKSAAMTEIPSRERSGWCSSVLRRRLKALHERYGEFAEENGYVRCEDKEVVSKIFSRLRGDGSYRSDFGGYRVTAVRDLADGHGFDSEMADGKPSLPLVAGGAHFLTFKFGGEGVVATLRTSGTEPKIKFYLEMQGPPGVPIEEVSAQLSKVAQVFLDEGLQLKRWGIERVALA